MPTLTELIKQEALQLGFDVVGIARIPSKISGDNQKLASPHPDPPLPSSLYSRLLDWLHRGYHGTMEWMARKPERRADPQLILTGCQSLICLGMNYYTPNHPEEEPGFGRIARYAWGEDYHRVFARHLKRLETIIQELIPQCQTRSYVDTGPVMEKAWAQEAGLGWVGKHSNLVSTEFGSWLLLGEILTTLELEPDEPGSDLCGSCALCIQACPTGAITEPYLVDSEKCISYLTIEYRGDAEDLSQEVKSQMGNRIFGCDDCLDICPFNVNAQPSRERAFQPSPLSLRPRLSTLSGLSEPAFQEAFQHSPIRRAKHQGFLRNLSIATQNAGRTPEVTSTQQ